MQILSSVRIFAFSVLSKYNLPTFLTKTRLHTISLSFGQKESAYLRQSNFPSTCHFIALTKNLHMIVCTHNTGYPPIRVVLMEKFQKGTIGYLIVPFCIFILKLKWRRSTICPKSIRKSYQTNSSEKTVNAFIDLKRIRIHDFQYSHTSSLINGGMNISLVSKRLGHTNITETLNTYSHMFEEQRSDCIDFFK